MNTLMISVVMPVYNGEKYLREAIYSILTQTYTNFEFIILNDGSTDKTEEIILSYTDPRIVYVKNEENLQIVKTLNKGIALAKGKYIARMDADDISLPERFEKQMAFMVENPDVDVCGSWMKILDSKKQIWSYPEKHEEIKAQLLFNTPLAHPTLLIKKTFFENFEYETFSDKAEDYYLWSKSIDVKKFSNISEVFLLYRLHPNQTCNTSREKQVVVANSVREVMLRRMVIVPTPDDMIVHTNFSLLKLDLAQIGKLRQWLKKIIDINKKTNYFDEQALESIIGIFWKRLFYSYKKRYTLNVFWAFISFPYHKSINISMLDYIKFIVKCIIGWRS